MHFYGTATINDKGHLTIGGCDTVELAATYGTPLYVMDEAYLRGRMQEYTGAFAQFYPNTTVAYASKAFLCQAMAAMAHQEGLALDVASGGEIATVLAAGVPAAQLIFHGNNKTPHELHYALSKGVGRIVVDSHDELNRTSAIAQELGVTAPILLRLTPGISAHTHHYISTGQLDSKFGTAIDTGAALELVKAALAAPGVELRGVHCHIGSQIFDVAAFKVAAEKVIAFVADAKQSTGWVCKDLNLGGGLGIRYTAEDEPTTPAAMAQILAETVKESCAKLGLDLPHLLVEPGRSIVAEGGTTLYTIGTRKEIPGIRTYVAVDGGMTDNPRPALYQAVYEAAIANRANVEPSDVVTVAGHCCESGDMLIHDVKLADPKVGDTLAVFVTGAYNYAMASHYNRFAKPAVVLVGGGRADVIVERESYEDLMAFDRIPARLQGVASK